MLTEFQPAVLIPARPRHQHNGNDKTILLFHYVDIAGITCSFLQCHTVYGSRNMGICVLK